MKINTWIVVVSKDETRIFNKPNLAENWSKVQVIKRDHIDTDHSFKTVGHNANNSSSHAALDEGKTHRKIYDHYFHGVADVINKARSTQQFAHLFLVAPPESMGEVKNHLDKEALKHLKKSINKDLVHLNQAELEDYMKDDFIFYGDLHK